MSGTPKQLNPDGQYAFSDEITWGDNVTFGANCRSVSIGHGCFIGRDVYIDVEELTLGDYVTLHHGSVIHGKSCAIGHNCWFGHYTIIDCLGGRADIGNNVGVGAHSQLWSHMRFGDRLAGCRWYRNDNLEIGDDAWLVGHTIVATPKVGERSMLLVGGVATRTLEDNKVYAGTPAVDVSEKMGPQFEPVDPADRRAMFADYLEEFAQAGGDTSWIRTVDTPEDFDWTDTEHTYFSLEARCYAPRRTQEETAFMRFLLYDRAKFIPVSSPS